VTVTVHSPQRRRLTAPVVFAALAVTAVLIGADVPSWFDNRLQPAALDLYDWVSSNRPTHWLFSGVFTPIADAIDWCVARVLSLLTSLRWPGVLALVAVVGARTGGWRAALAGTAAMAMVGVLGFWEPTMVTLSIMLVAIVGSVLVGLPLGIAAARRPWLDRLLRPFLDTAQVIPAFVYLGLLVLLFSIEAPPVVVATMIFAIPPAVRITVLAIRQVPTVLNEVGQSFGATRRQQLWKVQLPVARRMLLLGLNQVIMMAFAIVVFGSYLGVADVGNEVKAGLDKVRPDIAFAPGLAIVFAAIALDRISTGERRTHHRRLSTRTGALVGCAVVLAAVVAARVLSTRSFPDSLVVDIRPPAADALDWVNDHLRNGVPIIGGTEPISDFVVVRLIEPLKKFLVWLPWLLVVVAASALGYVLRGWRLAATVAAALLLIASMGVITSNKSSLWDNAMDTLSQVLIAVVLSVIIAVPIGVLAGRRPRFFGVIRPLLDGAQVLPQFVYLVPVLFLFGVGRSAGVIASIIYAVPPGVRLTAQGLRSVPWAPREAAISFGATPGQELRKVQLPLAMRSILLGINQTVLMVLATVVIAALIGGGALGLYSLGGFQKQQSQFGQGLAAGVSIVCLAVVLDRLTQALGTPRAHRQAASQPQGDNT
jgi:glycine betaine/proline transport system permease protein